MFICLAIKHYKALWRVEDRAWSGRLKSVRAEAATKTVREWIRRNALWKQKIMSQKLNILTQSSHTSSGTIYTWEHTFAQRDTSLLLLWRKSEGQGQSVSSSGTLRIGTKISSSQMRKFSPSRSSITTRTTRFMLKCPLRCILRVQEAITLPTSWFGGGVPSGGDTSSFLRERCENWCSSVSRGCATRSCETANTTVFSGQKWVFQQDSAPAHKAEMTHEWPQRNVPAFISDKDWPSGSPDLNPLAYKLCDFLENMACWKHHNNLDCLKRSPWRRCVPQ